MSHTPGPWKSDDQCVFALNADLLEALKAVLQMVAEVNVEAVRNARAVIAKAEGK